MSIIVDYLSPIIYSELLNSIKDKLTKAILSNIHVAISITFSRSNYPDFACRTNFFKNGNTVYVISRECINEVVQGGFCFDKAISNLADCHANLTVPYYELPDDYQSISGWDSNSIWLNRDLSAMPNATFENCVNNLLSGADQCIIDDRNFTENMVIAGIFGIPAGICIVGCAIASVVRFIKYRKYKAEKAKQDSIELNEIKIQPANGILPGESDKVEKDVQTEEKGSADISKTDEKEDGGIFSRSEVSTIESTTESTLSRSENKEKEESVEERETKKISENIESKSISSLKWVF